MAAKAPQLIFNDQLNATLTALFLLITWVLVVDTLRTCRRHLAGVPSASSEAPYVATRLRSDGLDFASEGSRA